MENDFKSHQKFNFNSHMYTVGLYDCASSDCCKMAANRKSSGRRKERKRSKSPAKVKDKDIMELVAPTQILLDVPGKADPFCRHNLRTKPSPKRRVRTHSQVASSTSSSSTESINSVGSVFLSQLTTEKEFKESCIDVHCALCREYTSKPVTIESVVWLIIS